MSSENVTSLRGAALEGDANKQRFLDWLAAAYDEFAGFGCGPPSSFVFVLATSDGPQSVGWTMSGEADNKADAMVSRAVIGIQRKLMETN